jgi:hypothetical protein
MRIKNYISKKRFSMKQVVSVLVVVFLGITVLAYAAVSIPNNFTPNTTAKASEVNANFNAVKTAIDALEASRTKYYSLSMWAAQRSARSDFQGVINTTSGLYYSSGSNFLDIPIHLPNGANIEEVEAYVYDTNATANIEVRLYQGTLNNTLSVGLGSVASSGSNGAQTLTYTLPTPQQVGNSSAGYFIQIIYGTTAGDTSVGIYGIRIKYSLTL